jgi:hypothetical protein
VPLAACAGVSCSGHGECFARFGEPYCDCADGFRPGGLACVEVPGHDPCAGVDCNGHGACVPTAAGAAACDCDRGFADERGALLCFALDDVPPRPTDLAAGRVVTVEGLEQAVNDVLRTRAGTLLVSTNGADGEGRIRLARSTDGGETWDVRLLENTTQPVYAGRLFAIDEGTIGLTGAEGSRPPYDGYLRYSATDGAVFSEEWINVSNMPAASGEPQTAVIATPAGRYLAVIPHLGYHLRLSDALDAWPDDAPHGVVGTASLGAFPALARLGGALLLAFPAGDVGFEVQVSHDDGATFARLALPVRTERPLTRAVLYADQAEGELYACGVAPDEGGDDDRVYTYLSSDGGAAWAERLLVAGLRVRAGSATACFVDETGVYVAYRDARDEQVRLVLPGEPSLCGNDMREPGEACDGTDLFGQDCVDFGFGSGDLACADDCAFDMSACAEPMGPTRCAEVNSRLDGVYTIDADGLGPNPAFEVYCRCMDLDDPACADVRGPLEYLQLRVTDGDANATHWVYTSAAQAAICRYSRVRFADVATLSLDGFDQTFAECEGDEAQRAGAQYGHAWACLVREGPDGEEEIVLAGQMSIDLTGTPFVLDYGAETGMRWEGAGWLWEYEITRDEGPGRVVEAIGGGFCGGVGAAPALRLTFAPAQ